MRASASNNLIQAMEPAPTAMNAARHFVVVKAPVDRVYEQWSRLEDLPKFVTLLGEVRRIDDTHFAYRWHSDGSDDKRESSTSYFKFPAVESRGAPCPTGSCQAWSLSSRILKRKRK